MTADVAASDETGGTGIAGYVEAASDAEIVGWSWRAGSGERLRVELRLDEEVIAWSTADQQRADLSKNGVGDGRHGFRLTIPDRYRGRASQIQTVAVDESGRLTLLNAPPALKSSNEIVELQRRMDLVLGSQRVLHRNIQAALLQQTQPLADTLAAMSASQARVDASIETVELFAVRLEQMLATDAGARLPRSNSIWLQLVAAIATGACLLACAALWQALKN